MRFSVKVPVKSTNLWNSSNEWLPSPHPHRKKESTDFNSVFSQRQGPHRDVLCKVWYSNFKDASKIKSVWRAAWITRNSSKQRATDNTSASAQAQTGTNSTHTHTRKMVVYRQHVSQLPSVMMPQQQWRTGSQAQQVGKAEMRQKREGGCWCWEMFLTSNFQKPTDWGLVLKMLKLPVFKVYYNISIFTNLRATYTIKELYHKCSVKQQRRDMCWHCFW